MGVSVLNIMIVSQICFQISLRYPLQFTIECDIWCEHSFYWKFKMVNSQIYHWILIKILLSLYLSEFV